MNQRLPIISEHDLPSATDFATFYPFIKGVFSQWHATAFEIDGVRLVTAEQWMMLAKARLFEDTEVAAAILATADPAQQKRLGTQVTAFDQAVWDHHKIDIVYRGNLAKFQQNDGAGRQLKATGESMLVEANPRDWIWGAGLAVDDPLVLRPDQWKGTNLLGRILTMVRAELA